MVRSNSVIVDSCADMSLASRKFVHEYYAALNGGRQEIENFYMDFIATPDGKSLPTIIYNGNVVPDRTAMQSLFQQQMPQTRYEVQSYDCHILNPDFVMEGVKAAATESGRNMSILLSVSGFVKYGESRSADPRGFSETFILIPNPAVAPSARGKRSREWIIQSQTFRQVS